MIINNKHVQGIFIYSPDVEYEKGDFVVSGDSIYICTAANPTNPLTFTVIGIDPESDSTGNYKIYPGDKISTVQEYYDYVNNNLYWNYKDTKEEVERALGVGAGGLVILGNLNNRSDLPNTKKEGDVYRIGTPSTGYEYAYVPYLEDKYISGNVLNQILQDAFFGVNEKGVVTNHVYAETDDNGVLHLDYSIGGTLASIEEGKILNAIMKSPDLNNGMFNVARSLPEISGFIDLDSTIETVLVRQYTYADNSLGNKRIRIQELVDPESSTVYYRWAEGIGVSLNTYDPNKPYHINDVVYYKDKAWISKENNNSGNLPGTDEDWWTEFSGDWSYENITAWTSSFSAGASKVSAQLDSIKAFYTKKIAELEATKKQLTGAFCNREVNLSNYENGNPSQVELRAGDNVKMHSSWRFIESDEGDLLQKLQISSLSDIFTLFKSTSQVDNLLNTRQLNNITIVVRVGSSNNFTYSYSKNGNPWQHGNTITSLLQNLGEDKLSDIFKVDTNTYDEYSSLPNPDFPFTVILKNRSNGEMKVTVYEPYGNAKWNVGGRTLFDQVGLNKKLSTIYYEDLAYNDAILGVANINSGAALVGNTATIDVYKQEEEFIESAVSRLSIPSILPVSNEDSPFLVKSSFAEPVCYFSGESTIPDFISSEGYKRGAIVMNGSIPYIAVNDITGGSGDIPGSSSPSNWMEYSSYIEIFNRWKSYYISPDGEAKTSLEILQVPYSNEFRENIWGSLVLGPAPKVDGIIYPISSVVVDSDGSNAKKTTRTVASDDSAWGDSLVTLSEDIKKFIPKYERLFDVESFRSRIEETANEPQTIVLDLTDPGVINYLDPSVGDRKPTGFFCIVYPCFLEEGSLVGYYPEEGKIDPFDYNKNAYYCFIDTRSNQVYLRSINDFGKSSDSLEDVTYSFLKDVKSSVGNIIEAIGTYIDNLAVRDSITGNLRITHINNDLSGLNIFFNVGYRGSHYISYENLTVFSGTISDGTVSSVIQGTFDYSSVPIVPSVPSNDLGYCVLDTSKICSDAINIVLKVGPDSSKDYNYYVTNSMLQCKPISNATSVNVATEIGDIKKIDNISSVFYVQGGTYSNNSMAVRYGERWKSKANNNTTTPYYDSNKWDLYDEGLDFRSGNYVYTGSSNYKYYKIQTNYVGTIRTDISYITGDIGFDAAQDTFKKYNRSTWVSLTSTDLPGVLLLDDTRLDVVLNNLGISGSSFPIDLISPDDEFFKVTLALRTKFGYLVRKNNTSSIVMVKDGNYNSTGLPETPTKSQLLDILDTVNDANVLLETNGFYLPHALVKDISSVSAYPQEYKLVYNISPEQKNSESWVIGAGPLERLLEDLGSEGDPYPSILAGISQVTENTIVNYEVPVRTVCVKSGSDSNRVYFVNGNYWVCGSHPANDSDYIKWNDNVDIFGDVPNSMNDLPDAFSLGKIYVVIGQGRYREEWYVVQNPDWLEIELGNDGSFYDKNRRADVKRWWLSTDRNYTCSEEILFEILHTNFVINTTDANSQRYKGILWSPSYKYFAGDIVIYHADNYNPTTTYSANSIVSYSGELWKANVSNVTGEWDPSKWTDLGVADFSLWKCTTPTSSTGTIPASTEGNSYWSVYGDPLFNTLTYVPSKTVLLSNVSPSVPFNLITKIGSTTNYSVAVNSRMSDFGTPCIATFLLQQNIDNLYYCYTITIDLFLDGVSSMSYYVTNDIILTVSGDNDKVRTVSVTGGATIKNIYYRYTI